MPRLASITFTGPAFPTDGPRFTFLIDGQHVYEAISWLDAVNQHLAAHPEARRIHSITRIN